MIRIGIEGLLLGLSTGAYCMGMCLAFFMPYLLAEGKERIRENGAQIALFMLGRLIAYASFALIVGFLGAASKGILTDKLAHVSLIVASLFMLTYAVTRRFSKTKFCENIFVRYPAMRLPFFLGLFSGLSPCYPFIVGATRLWTLHSIGASVVLFGGFFAGTSVYMMPLLCVSFLNRIERVKQIGLIVTLLSGVWFLFVGVTGLLH